MSQHDYNIADQSGSSFLTDINNALAAIVSLNSGATEPATMFAYQPWVDTTTGKLKVRNAANSAWIEVGAIATTNLGLALVAGASTQTFSVADATAIAHAVRADQIQKQSLTAYTTAGTSTAYTITTLGTPIALTTGERWRIKFDQTAGAAPTLNRDGKGAKALKLYDSSGAKVAASATTIIANMLTDVEYDGTDYVILNQLPLTIASSAEVITGTDNAKAISALALKTALGFSAHYESAAQTLTSGGSLTLAHGLGRKPILIQMYLKCLTAEMGYSINDVVLVPGGAYGNANSSTGAVIVPDATNLNVRFGSNTNLWEILNYTTGTAAFITKANWGLIIEAWA